MRAPVLACAIAASLAAALAAGPGAFGRFALAAGLPGMALHLLDDPGWRGVALYRLGDFEGADEAFRRSGSDSTYNRGNSLAQLGQFDRAIAYYDAALFRDSGDEEARANRDLVATLVSPVVGEHRDGLSQLRQSEQSAGTGTSDAGTSRIKPVDREAVRKPIDAMSIAASDEWLAILRDEPGLYLKLRIAAEHERRQARGTGVPPGGSTW